MPQAMAGLLHLHALRLRHLRALAASEVNLHVVKSSPPLHTYYTPCTILDGGDVQHPTTTLTLDVEVMRRSVLCRIRASSSPAPPAAPFNCEASHVIEG